MTTALADNIPSPAGSLTPRDRFLKALAAGPLPDPQATLDDDDTLRRVLCAAYFLADQRQGHDVVVFVTETVPLLLSQLQRITERRRETYQGRVRGRIDWPATIKERYQAGYNPAIYVCRQPHRVEDTPENQLLAYVLHAVHEATLALAPPLLNAERWTAVSGSEPGWLISRLSRISQGLRPLLGHVRLRHVTTPAAITSHHLLRARTAKTELYSAAAQLYVHYHVLVRHHQWPALATIMQEALLLPLADDPLAEVALRLTAAGFLAPLLPGSAPLQR